MTTEIPLSKKQRSLQNCLGVKRMTLPLLRQSFPGAFSVIGLFVVAFALMLSGAEAAVQTWTNNTSTNNLSNSVGLWQGAVNPASGDSWVFANTSTATLTNNFAAVFTVAGITFNSGTAADTINGNSINLNGSIINNSTNLQTFGTAFVLQAAQTITTKSGGGNFLFNGNITGAFGLSFTGSGTTTLAGNNSNTTITLNGGANSTNTVINSGVSSNASSAGSAFTIGGTAGSTNIYWNSGTNWVGQVVLEYGPMATGANLLTNSGLLYATNGAYIGNQAGTTNNVVANSGTFIATNNTWNIGARAFGLLTNSGNMSNSASFNLGSTTAAGSGAFINSGNFTNSGTFLVGNFNGAGMNNYLWNTGSGYLTSSVTITVGNNGGSTTINAFTNDVSASAYLTGLTIGTGGSSTNQMVNNGNLTNVTTAITVGNGASGLNVLSNSTSGSITIGAATYLGANNSSTGTNQLINNGNISVTNANSAIIVGGGGSTAGGMGYNLLTNNGNYTATNSGVAITIGKAGSGTNQLAIGAGTFTAGNQTYIGGGGTGLNLLTVASGATLNLTNLSFGFGLGGNNSMTNAGNVTISGTTTLGNNYNNGAGSTATTNTFTQTGGNFSGGSVYITGNSQVSNAVNTFTINGGVMTLSGNLRVGVDSGTSTGTNTVTLGGGTLVINGNYSLLGGSNTLATNSFVWTGGTLSAANINTTNGGWSTPLASSAIANGTLNNTLGNLLVGNLTNGYGGKTAITGNYTQGGSATSTFDLYGSTAATTWTGGTNQYSQLTVSGNANVGGNIVLNFGGFSTAATTYNILTAAGLSGNATIAGPNAVNGYAIAGDGFSLMTLATNGTTLVVTNSGLRNEWTGGTATWDSSTNLWSQGINPGTNNGRGAYFGTNGGGGTVTLADNKTISSLVFSNASAGYNLASSGTPTITLGNTYGATIMNYAGSHTVTPAISLVTNLLVGSSGTLTIAGNISGNASVTATNGGLTVLAGSNSYTGTTTIGSGAVDFQNTNALYGGNTNSWTAANLSAKSGGALIFGVGGAGGFTAAQISQLYTTLTNSSATVGLAANSYFGLDATGTNFTLNDVITSSANGALGFASVGTGTVTLVNSNSYTGGTLLRGGTIAYSNVNAFGTGTITATNNATISDVVGTGVNTLARAITVASGATLTFNATQYTNASGGSLSNMTTLSGTINGAGTLNIVGTKSGTSYSAAYLSGTSTSLGSLVLSNVVLNYAGNNISTNVTLNGASISGDSAASRTLAAGSVITLGSAGGSLKQGGSQRSLVVNSTITGSGDLYITRDDGSVQLNAANTYTGRTVLGDTTFWNWSGNANYYLVLGTNNAISTNGLVMNNGTTGRLKMNGYNATVAYISGSAGLITNASATGASTLTVTPNGTNAVYAGTIVDVGGTTNISLVLNGSGTQTLSGSNSYSGGTILNAGTLAVSNSNALGSGIVNFASNSTLSSLASMRLTNNAAISNGVTASYNVASGTTLTNAGTITGSGGSLAASGSGTLVLSAANTYDGGTVVNSGTLVQSNASAFGATTGSLNLAAGTLNVGGYNNTFGTVYFGNGVLAFSAGGGTLTAGSFTATNSSTVTLSNSLAGGSLAAGGSGTLVLTASNSYAGATTVNGGALVLSNANALGAATNSLNNNATLNLNGNAISVGSLAGSGSGVITNGNSTGVTLSLGGNNTSTTYAGTITSGTGSIGLTKTGSGTTTLSGNNTYTGGTVISQGQITVGNANALGAATNSLNNNATLNLNGNDISVGSLAGSGVITNGNSTGVTLSLGGNNTSTTYAGTITSGTGSIGLTKIGSGTTILSGINTYTGVTTVNGGALNLTGRLNGTTAVTVNSGSSLLIGQNGGITNSSTLTLNGGTLQLGTSGLRVGTQSFSSLTLTADSSIDFTSLAGDSSITFGSITGLSGNKLSIYNWSNTEGNSTKLFSTAGLNALQLGNISFYSGGLGSSSFLGIGGFAGGGFSGGQIVPVPEPGVVIAAVMLLGWLLISNRGALLALIRRRSA